MRTAGSPALKSGWILPGALLGERQKRELGLDASFSAVQTLLQFQSGVRSGSDPQPQKQCRIFQVEEVGNEMVEGTLYSYDWEHPEEKPDFAFRS